MATNCRLTSGGLFLFGTCPLISPRRANGEMTAGYNGAVWARNRMATLEKRDGRGSGAHGDYDAICRLRHGKCWSPRLPDSHEPITSLVDRNVDTSIIFGPGHVGSTGMVHATIEKILDRVGDSVSCRDPMHAPFAAVVPWSYQGMGSLSVVRRAHSPTCLSCCPQHL
ncbi:hypothetical protein BHE74_00008976 [Ensete ventricosum]|nr:hypothetical protein BHE74_00008976 [Ensete ventricosum]